MKGLTTTLNMIMADIFYFLIIFTLFLMPFVGMGYISFGPEVIDFSTLGNAIRKCFEIAINNFDFYEL